MCVHQWVLSSVWLFATPWTVACQALLSVGFPRQEYWSGLPFPSPGDLPTQGSNIAGGFFTSEPLYTQLPVIIIYLWLLAYPKLIVTTSAHIKISNSEWEFGQNAEKEEIEGKYWSQRLLLMEFFSYCLDRLPSLYAHFNLSPIFLMLDLLSQNNFFILI